MYEKHRIFFFFFNFYVKTEYLKTMNDIIKRNDIRLEVIQNAIIIFDFFLFIRFHRNHIVIRYIELTCSNYIMKYVFQNHLTLNVCIVPITYIISDKIKWNMLIDVFHALNFIEKPKKGKTEISFVNVCDFHFHWISFTTERGRIFAAIHV